MPSQRAALVLPHPLANAARAIRALGLNMEEEDFEEILEAQLSKLEEAS
ncbi:hypothetical protein HGQ17_13690 [Nesterenkonia sp. MY13]|uniref:Uncharacterized protein n=1 Tax=Nesterenkonia sedimenti TaxID=1463632 RepID=A0A7X8TLR9_9MICC|nr:hypothetical protein [Nesterenkonia sedimenti]NLS11028.1 hypothetical protein [Nesterenkonia sedimenti]